MLLNKILGHHIISELRDCNEKTLNDLGLLVQTMTEACKLGGAGVIGHIENKFEPHGVTVLVLLSESHASIHTYPEYGYAAIDVFTCGDHVNSHVIVDYIHKSLGGNMKIKDFDRGIPNREDSFGLINN